MNISIASDHGGFALKERVAQYLKDKGYEVTDCGTYSSDSCDYPDFGAKAARLVSEGKCQRGIVICTTGIGIGIAANKIKGVRLRPVSQHRYGFDDAQTQRRQYACDGRKVRNRATGV